jgi:hypothetical protein
MSCMNLFEMFGNKYKVTFDRDSAEGPRDKDPWLQQIPLPLRLDLSSVGDIPGYPPRSPPGHRHAAGALGL